MYTDEEIHTIKELREEGYTWPETATQFNLIYDGSKSAQTLRMALTNWKLRNDVDQDETDISLFKSARTIRKTNSKLRREANIILDEQINLDDAVETLLSRLNGYKIPSVTLPKPPTTTGEGAPMVVELLLSDWQIGKKNDNYNLSVAETRLLEVKRVLHDEIHRHSRNYQIEKIIVGSLGDMIESATMHDLESAVGCEMGNSEQIFQVYRLLLEHIILPLMGLGIPVEFHGVAGNHDREGKYKTYHHRGEAALTYVIYKTLEHTCKLLNLPITFHIPKGLYSVADVFNQKILYEHYDEIKKPTKDNLETLINKRRNQLKVHIDFIRGGHFHEYVNFDHGALIVNPSLCGSDPYSEALGFATVAGQTINYYVKTSKRSSNFYYSFPIRLE